MSKYYYQENAEECHKLEYHYRYMTENDIQEMTVYEAKVVKEEGFFYCRHYKTMGDDHDCGNHCDFYIPRNGIKGRCTHHSSIYEPTKLTKTLKLKT